MPERFEETQGLDDDQWVALIRSIEAKRCTPFLGAGTSAHCWTGIDPREEPSQIRRPPLGGELAARWSTKFRYPWDESPPDLARVAQFIHYQKEGRDGLTAAVKREFYDDKDVIIQPDFTNKAEPHLVLAALPFEIYVTTNYDDFMYQALTQTKPKKYPQRDLCRWCMARGDPRYARTFKNWPERVGDDKESPTVERPLVYHMHGVLDVPDSLVITEDDYTDFVVALTEREDELIPKVLKGAFCDTLLFLGYTLRDPNLRVIFRSLQKFIRLGARPENIAVQLPPSAGSVRDTVAACRYIKEYLHSAAQISIEWCDFRQFAAKLQNKWDTYGVKSVSS